MDATTLISGIISGAVGFGAAWKILENKIEALEKEILNMKSSQEKRDEKFMTREMCAQQHKYNDRVLSEMNEKIGRIESMLMRLLESGKEE